MTAVVSHESQAEVKPPAASSQSVARYHLWASLVFLVVGVFMLAIASLQYVSPDLLSGSGWVSYGRLRPAAIHFLLYGWLTLGLIGAIYYAVPRLVGAELTRPLVAKTGFVLMTLGYAIGGIAILAGATEGVRYLEAPPAADLVVLLGMAAMLHSVVRTIAIRRDHDRSPAEWYMLAAVLSLVALHIVGNYRMLTMLVSPFSSEPVLHGINGALLAAFYRAGMMGLWLAAAGVGIVYFVVPRLVGLTTFRPTRMSVVGFWGLGIVWVFTGSAELTYTAVPNWLETIGVMFSMALLLPVATIIADVMAFLRTRHDEVAPKNRYSLNLIYVGLGMFGALAVLNLMSALRASGGIVGQTDWVYGVELIAVLGAFSAWLFAYVFHVAPPMESATAVRVQAWHGWLTLLGLVVAGFAMLAGGVASGLNWAGSGAGGVAAAGDGWRSTADVMWQYGFSLGRTIGLMIYAVAQALLVSYAATAWFLADDRGAVLAGDPDLDSGGQPVNEELAVPVDALPGPRRVASIVLAAGVVAFALVVLLPSLDAGAATPSILADSSRTYAAGSTAAIGRDIYVREGCMYCHTQSVRPIVTDMGLGAVSQAGDYAHEEPVVLGVARMGPDLMHVAARGETTVDQLAHPRPGKPWSTMPSYDYLSANDLDALATYLNGLK